MTIVRPVALALLAFAIAAFVLYIGYPIEQALFDRAGVTLPEWGADWLNYFSPLTFVLLAFAALICGVATGLRPLSAGHSPVRHGLVGLMLGIVLVTVAVLTSYLTGNAKIVAGGREAGLVAFAVGTAIILVQSFGEEAFFRGWLFPALARHWDWKAAALVSTFIFVAAHNLVGLFVEPFALANVWTEGNGLWVNLNLFLGGMVFALLYRLSGGVVAPTMFHFSWNWSDYLFFGLTPNPGRLSFGALIDVDLAGRAQVGGIADGMMANIFATIILLAILVSLVLFVRREGRHPPVAKPTGRVTPPPAPVPLKAAESPAPIVAAPPVVDPDPAPAPPTESVSPVEPEPAPAAPSAPVEIAGDHTIFMPGSAPLPPVKKAETTSPDPVPDRDQQVTLPATPITELAEAAIPEGGLVFTGTHEGCVREVNEDRFIAKAESGLFAVADGMGGHKFGDRASTMIIEHLDNADTAIAIDVRIGRVSSAIIEANRAIFEEAQTNGSRMGSTVVALLTEKDRFAVLWAGDSRAYRLRGKDIERLTKDHTQVQEMVDRGLLAPEDVARHPMSHVLVRAVGVNPDIELDTATGKIEKGDVFFLCSDGIYDVLEEDEIGALLEKAASGDVMERMIKMSLDLGARDNVTGIIVVPDAAA